VDVFCIIVAAISIFINDGFQSRYRLHEFTSISISGRTSKITRGTLTPRVATPIYMDYCS